MRESVKEEIDRESLVMSISVKADILKSRQLCLDLINCSGG